MSIVVIASGLSQAQQTQKINIDIDRQTRLHSLSQYLTGACIEDVNHEIYGGIYSQMIFGESFQEPAPAATLRGFNAFGGDWFASNGVVGSPVANGNKLVSQEAYPENDEFQVDIWFEDASAGNAGLIVRTSNPRIGVDRFHGYEIALDPARQMLRLGRHRNDFVLLQDTPCTIETRQWVRLSVSLSSAVIRVSVDGAQILEYTDSDPLRGAGQVGLRQFHPAVRYRRLVAASHGSQVIPFSQSEMESQLISRMWQPIRSGNAQGLFSISGTKPFVGRQSQRMEFVEGQGTWGISNQGLNGWGMSFESGHTYEGELYARAERPCEFWVSAETDSTVLDEQKIVIESAEWTRLTFSLTPNSTTREGRFVLKLKQPGGLALGYVMLQPGPWGRFHDLPLRRDVVEGLIGQGITALRYGGSMVDNPPDYRWKNMIGPRALRKPYVGHWYEYSSNGWGILDFMNLCEAAGFLGIPCFSIDESPQDMLDFLEYANGSAASPWGAKRVLDGHENPYQLKFIQLGNEESVNDDYWKRFEPIARELWRADPKLTLIIGEFMFDESINDPFQFRGSPAGITSLATHRQILKLAKEFDAEVWFDTHIWTAGPDPTPSMNAFFTYVDAIDSLADGARHKVVVFELNANNHRQRRALANAEMIGRIMRDGRVPVALSANCLQPDGQNDNGWDQGLLFLNNSKVWLQPPGHVTQMIAEAWQPWVLKATVHADADEQESLDVVVSGAEDDSSFIIRIVNRVGDRRQILIATNGKPLRQSAAEVISLSAPLQANNTVDHPDRVKPLRTALTHQLPSEPAILNVEPYSFTTIHFK